MIKKKPSQVEKRSTLSCWAGCCWCVVCADCTFPLRCLHDAADTIVDVDVDVGDYFAGDYCVGDCYCDALTTVA